MSDPLIDSASRRKVLRQVADAVLATAQADRPALVAIDGVDGAGKTTFAEELALVLSAARPVIRASLDSFHQPRAARYRLGRSSPEGFFRESYDYSALKAALLDPLRSGGRPFRRAVFDVDADRPVDAVEEQAAPGSILVFDGVFLHRPELRDYWDFSVFLDVPWEKNHHLPKQPEWAVGLPDPSSAEHRYAEGQRMYFRECDPRRAASMVIDNTNLAEPSIVKPEP